MTDITCPRCSGENSESATYCQHCAFLLPQLVDATDGSRALDDKHQSGARGQWKYTLVGLVLGIALIGIFVAFILIRDSQVASNPDSAVQIEPDQELSRKAQEVEEKILRGEVLSTDDIEGISAGELRILRNVHFARYGRKYDRPGLGDYFYSRSWYKPNPSYNDRMLTSVDKQNVSLILSVEKPELTSTATNSSANTNFDSPDSRDDTANSQPEVISTPFRSDLASLSESDLLRILNERPIKGVCEQSALRRVEILRVGAFNSERNYWPIRGRVKINSQTFQIWDIVVVKDDYGDFVAHKRGC